MKPLLIATAVLLLSACTTPVIVVKKNVDIQQLGIYLKADDPNLSFIAGDLHRAVDDFILRHNANSRRKFDVYKAEAKDSASLRVAVLTTKLVSPGQQVVGVVASAVGLSLPFVIASAGAPIIFGFYYFPRVRSLTELSVSPDLAVGNGAPRMFVYSSPGFLKSPERQIVKHGVYFNDFLKALVTQIERQAVKKKHS